MNNHGSFAKAGDLVEAINPMGQPTGLYGLIVGEHIMKAIVPKRILHVLVTWKSGAEIEHMKDSYVRVVNSGDVK